jgi:hypothetical protein
VFDVATRVPVTPDLPGWGQPGKPERVGWSPDGRRTITWARVFRKGDVQWDALAWDPITGHVVGPAPRATWRDSASGLASHVGTEGRNPVPRDVAGHWIPSNASYASSADGALLAAGQPPGYEPTEPPEPGADPGPFICRRRVDRDRRFENPSVVEVWTGRALVTVPVRRAKDLAISPDHRTLAVGQPDGVHLYDVLTGRERLVCKVPAYPRADPEDPAEEGLVFSPDGRRLAVIELGGTVLIFDVAERRERREIGADEFDRLWADLAAGDPKVGWAAVFRLVDDPAGAMRLFDQRLTPVGEPAAVARLVTDLNSPRFRVREAASRRLLDLGDAARPSVAAARKEVTDPEARQRLDAVLATLADKRPPPAVDLRRLRAVVILDRIGTADARARIDELAGGLASARATAAAGAAAKRLAGRE